VNVQSARVIPEGTRKKSGAFVPTFGMPCAIFDWKRKVENFGWVSSTRIGLMHDYVTFPKFTTKPRLHLIILIL